MSSIPEFPLRILYDGACPICSREVEHYRRLDHAARLVPVDISAPGFDPGPYGIPLQVLMSDLHAIDRCGEIYRGVEAFLAIWRAFPERMTCRLLAAAVSLPALKLVARSVYRGFARIRPRLPGRKGGCAAGVCRIGKRDDGDV